MRHNIQTLQAMGISIGHVRVMLNGVETKRVVAFDEDEGYLTRYKLDDDGRAMVRDDCFVEERVEGVVEAWLLWAGRIGEGGGRQPHWPHATPAPAPWTCVRLRSVLR